MLFQSISKAVEKTQAAKPTPFPAEVFHRRLRLWTSAGVTTATLELTGPSEAMDENLYCPSATDSQGPVVLDESMMFVSR